MLFKCSSHILACQQVHTGQCSAQLRPPAPTCCCVCCCASAAQAVAAPAPAPPPPCQQRRAPSLAPAAATSQGLAPCHQPCDDSILQQDRRQRGMHKGQGGAQYCSPTTRSAYRHGRCNQPMHASVQAECPPASVQCLRFVLSSVLACDSAL
jgi:hypothetical protein